MTEFDYLKFYDLTEEIEKYLGILKGNELVREYDQRVFEATEMAVFITWSSPAPEYACEFFGMTVPDNRDYPDVHHQTIDTLKQNWTTAFNNGPAWAAGIGGYLRDLCADVANPDAGSLRSCAQTFGDTAATLEGVVPVDWTDLDFNSWIGLSSDACEQVVDNFQAKFRDEYAFYFTYAQAIFAGAGAVVVQTQKGLNPTLEAVRDILKAQLAAWQENAGRQPSDRSAPPAWLADVGQIVSNVLDLIPVVSEVKGKLESVVGVADGVLALFDQEVGGESVAFDAMTAEQVYTKTTTVLNDEYVKAMRDGLDKLQANRADAVVTAQNAISPWLIDTLGGLSNEPWQHAAEG